MAKDTYIQVMLLEHYFAIHIFLDEGMPAKQGERKRNVGRHVGFLFVAMLVDKLKCLQQNVTLCR